MNVLSRVIFTLLSGIIWASVVQADVHRIYYDFEMEQDTVFLVKNFVDARVDKGDTLEFYICSPGGSVTSSLDLYNYLCSLKSRKIKVITIATGLCASGGTIVFQAGDVRLVNFGTMFMIHKAYIPGLKWYQKIWMYFYSDESLDYCNSLIYGVLSARSGRSMEQVRKDLDHDNYLYCHEILLMGYADGIVPIKTKR